MDDMEEMISDTQSKCLNTSSGYGYAYPYRPSTGYPYQQSQGYNQYQGPEYNHYPLIGYPAASPPHNYQCHQQQSGYPPAGYPLKPQHDSKPQTAYPAMAVPCYQPPPTAYPHVGYPAAVGFLQTPYPAPCAVYGGFQHTPPYGGDSHCNGYGGYGQQEYCKMETKIYENHWSSFGHY